MVMKLQIFTIKKFLSEFLSYLLAAYSLDSALKKNENYYPQVIFKKCKYIQKNVIRHISDNLSDFFYLDEE